MAELPPQFDGDYGEEGPDLSHNPYIDEDDREVIYEYLDIYVANSGGFSAQDWYNSIYDYYFDEFDVLHFDFLTDAGYEGERTAGG